MSTALSFSNRVNSFDLENITAEVRELIAEFKPSIKMCAPGRLLNERREQIEVTFISFSDHSTVIISDSDCTPHEKGDPDFIRYIMGAMILEKQNQQELT